MTDAAAGKTTPDTWDTSLLALYGYEPTMPEVHALCDQAFQLGFVNAETPAGRLLEVDQALGGLSAARCHALLIEAAIQAGIVTKVMTWLAKWFAPHHVIEVSAIIPAGTGRYSAYGRLGYPEEASLLAEFIRANWGRVNLYYGANPRTEGLLGTQRAAKSDDVASRHLVVFDHDDGPTHPEERAQWERDAIAMHRREVIASAVRSGNGLQLVIQVAEEAGLDTVKSRQGQLKQLYLAAGSDTAVHNADRVFRLPYTVNIPNASKRKKQRVLVLTSEIVDLDNV